MHPIGTQAHEWFMLHGSCYGYQRANTKALDKWTSIYRGDLGIALTDTYTSKVFFRDFNPITARIYDGVRHDSGSPYEFARDVVSHYQKLRIDPTTKTIVFSDGLDHERIVVIKQFCDELGIRSSFGIGTNLTNDVGVAPLNIVIKMTACKLEDDEWRPTIKLSDDKGKHTGSSDEINKAKKTLGIDQ